MKMTIQSLISVLKYINDLKLFFTVNFWPYKATVAQNTGWHISQLLWNEGTGDLLIFVASYLFALICSSNTILFFPRLNIINHCLLSVSWNKCFTANNMQTGTVLIYSLTAGRKLKFSSLTNQPEGKETFKSDIQLGSTREKGIHSLTSKRYINITSTWFLYFSLLLLSFAPQRLLWGLSRKTLEALDLCYCCKLSVRSVRAKWQMDTRG